MEITRGGTSLLAAVACFATLAALSGCGSVGDDAPEALRPRLPLPDHLREEAPASRLTASVHLSTRAGELHGTLADLIASLEEAQAAGRLQHRLKVLTHPALLIVDEIGYLPVTRTGATLFFQLVNRRYEHASTVLTLNKSFEEWGEIFGDEIMAAALIDRLLHHCHIVNIRGNSFRMRQHTELWQALHPDEEPEEVPTT